MFVPALQLQELDTLILSLMIHGRAQSQGQRLHGLQWHLWGTQEGQGLGLSKEPPPSCPAGEYPVQLWDTGYVLAEAHASP